MAVAIAYAPTFDTYLAVYTGTTGNLKLITADDDRGGFFNSQVTFNVSQSGSSTPSENTTVAVTLNSNITNLQDLINDIRNDLSGSGIGVDVRENPNNLGRL